MPDRAIQSAVISRFGFIDNSDGGSTYRYSVSADYQRAQANSVSHLTAYGLAYKLNLFSNFTYFLDNPVDGDQFEQADKRFVAGFRASHRRQTRWAGRRVENLFGVQLRNDDISNVGLYKTSARRRLSTVREDSVLQTSVAFYAQNEIELSTKVRTQVGLRGDIYRFKVDNDNALNSGKDTAGLVSPKFGVAFGPWRKTEVYVNGGYGFHSNDARGATITVDPTTGEPVQRVTPLARARGAEIGVRTVAIPHVQSTVAIWGLGIESELLFVGDAGTTEASRPSRRKGVEWTNYVSLKPWLTFDLDAAWSNARFTDDDPAGDRISGAVDTVVSAGMSIDQQHRVFGSVRLRYFGPRPLIEDNSVRSDATSLVNGQIGYAISDRVRVALDIFNLFDAKDSDIDYFYASRLQGEPLEGVDDIHTHPTIPRTVRLGFQVAF